jgi:plasmid stabilization system protein ParE
MGRVAGTHEFVSHPNYIIVYRRTLIAVEILNIVHSRQQYPKSVDKVQLRK